jgi:hypothetical protein
MSHGVLRFVAFLLRALSYVRVRWSRWRIAARARRDLRVACELREQRLEDADAPFLIASLHTLVHHAFATQTPAHRADINELLDRYADLLIHRQARIEQLRRHPLTAATLRYERAVQLERPTSASVIARRVAFTERCLDEELVLSRDIADLEALIRYYCEREIYATTGPGGRRGSPYGAAAHRPLRST